MNAAETVGGIVVFVAALTLFAWVSNADWKHEWLQLVTMAILIGAVAFGGVLAVQGMW